MEMIDLLKETESLLEGHFELSSGLHSDKYCQCAKLLQYPQHAETAGRKIAELFDANQIDAVLGPALGGIIIGYEVARALNRISLFTERKDGYMSLRRGFHLNEGDRVLIVEDVITTAKSVKENIRILKDYNAQLAGVACIVDRSMGRSGLELKSLIQMNPAVYSPDDCPLCREGVEMEKPGSKSRVTRYII
ncbi:MAG TPA: orotate phosphoribosyltransferase [Candidatus Gastranaerophilales bacterium]|nr:orotate phosphoribosyltransferase [Candidatus Gastranaerophilales bacterium]